MLRTDIVAGFLIAGLIGAFVPRSWWTTLFGLGAEGTFVWVLASAVIGVPDAPPEMVDSQVAVRVTDFDSNGHTGTAEFLEKTGESAF